MIENAHSTPGLKNRAMQSSSVTFVFCFTPRSNFLQLVLSCPASFDTYWTGSSVGWNWKLVQIKIELMISIDIQHLVSKRQCYIFLSSHTGSSVENLCKNSGTYLRTEVGILSINCTESTIFYQLTTYSYRTPEKKLFTPGWSPAGTHFLQIQSVHISAYIIFIIFAPRTRFWSWFLLHTKVRKLRQNEFSVETAQITIL